MRVAVYVDEIPAGAEDAFRQLWKIFPTKFSVQGPSEASARFPNIILLRLPGNQFKVTFIVFMSQSLASRPEEYLMEIAASIDSEVENELLRIITKALARNINTGNISAEASPLKTVPLFSFEGFDIEGPPGLVRPFAYKRVFMVGDALHWCPPLMDMGAAMGFEDVFELIVQMGRRNRSRCK